MNEHLKASRMPMDPRAALALADTLLSSFHEVERLTGRTRFDPERVAILLAGARDAIEDSIRLDHPVNVAERETSLSPQWVNMLMVRDIEVLSRFKAGMLAPSRDQAEMRPLRVFLGILIDILPLLTSPTLREPLERYFSEREGAPETAG